MVNKVTLIGRCGKAPEIRTTDNSKAASFTLATSERYKDRNGEVKENTEWHNIVAFDKTAELIEKFVIKGMLLYLEGKLRTRSWEDQNGDKRYVTEVLVNSIQFLEKREHGEVAQNVRSAKQHASSQAYSASTPQDDDLPF